DVLLTPTTVYAGAVLAARRVLRAAGHDLRGLAHVTGGGLPGNVPRALPADLAARVDPSRWRVPSVLRLVAARRGRDEEELRASFNVGLGLVAVVAPEAVGSAREAFASAGRDANAVGEVIAADDGPRYVEGPLQTRPG